MSTVDYVEAKFRGEQVRFRIGPRSLDLFEALHGSARNTLSRLVSGNWTVADLKAVLSAGHPRRMSAWSTIETALAANRPATYLPLATTILVAALTGIDAESAKFDEAA